MVGRTRPLLCLASACCALSVLSACASDEASASDPDLTAKSGPFVGTLTIEPNPPHVGTNHVVITLDAQSDGMPLEGATVMVSPWMPAHGHGSMDVEAVEQAPGVYMSEDVWLNMPGVWDLRVHVDADEPGDLTATVEVP